MFYYIYKEDKTQTIISYLSGYSIAKDKLNFLFNNNLVYVNSNIVNKDYELKEDDEIYVDTKSFDNEDVIAIKHDLDILYEDEYILVINKPSGVICYSDGDDSKETLSNYVKYYYEENGIDAKVRHIHRLDKDTTGVIIYAKDILTHSKLSKMIEDRKIVKEYLAIVKGKITEPIEITQPIARDRHISGKMICYKTGLSAYTYVEPLEIRNNTTLIRCLIKTGRHHQIRVHLSHINHPLIGDKLYDKNATNTRIKLHCYMMKFTHPVTKKTLEITAPVPNDMI